MRAEAFFIELEKHMTMTAFLLGHLFEELCRIRITLLEIFGEGHVDAAVLLLRGDCHCQYLALGQGLQNFSPANP
jgi:hypothetical protein